MLSTARHASIAVFVLYLAASTWPGSPAPPSSPAPSPVPSTVPSTAQDPSQSTTPDTPKRHAWIGVERDGVVILQHGVDPALAQHLARCPPPGPVRPGDRLTVAHNCATRITPLPARQRLALGLRLNVNTASSSDLQAVSGIGPALARRIIARRPYAALADLEKVRGIGPVRRQRLTSSLTPAPPPPLWPSLTSGASTLRRP